MSEVERRRGYRHSLVLIETARILDPQFSDVVVFLSGAQIELLRNVSQYLNRLETYVSEYQPGHYLAPTTEDYDSILAIVADLEETLMGNPNTIWGYKDRIYQDQEATSTGAAYTDVETGAVPSQTVVVCEAWAAMQDGGVPCDIAVYLKSGGDSFMLYTAPSLASGIYVTQGANLTLAAGDVLHMRVMGLPDTEKCYLWLWGHTMVVP